MRIPVFVALIFFAFSGAAFAQCELPTFGASYDSLSTAEKLAIMRKLDDYQICSWTLSLTTTQPGYLHASGEKALFESALAKFAADAEMLRNRTSLPSRAAFVARAERNKRLAADILALVTYQHLQWEIGVREQYPCPEGPASGCTSAPAFDSLKAEGKDPRQEFARIARDVRLQPKDPWFLIGKIRFDDQNRTDRGFQIVEGLKDAQTKYEVAKGVHDSFVEKLSRAQSQRDAAVARLRAPIKALEEKLATALAKGNVDTAKLKKNARYQDLTQFMAAGEKRSEQIDAAIENLFANSPADDTFAQDRIKALRAEQTQLAANVNAARAGRDALEAPEFDSQELQEISDLQDALFVDGNQARLRIRSEDLKLESAVNLVTDANKELAAAEPELAKALAARREWQAVKKTYFHSVNTSEADFRYDGDLPDMGPLNRAIEAVSRSEIQDAAEAERLRREMLEMVGFADEASTALRNAGLKSIGTQFATEIAFSAFDIGVAGAKGGMAGVAAEAWTQFILNLIFTPSYSDAHTGHLRDFIDSRRSTQDWKYLASEDDTSLAQRSGKDGGASVNWGQQTGAQIAKHILSQPKDVYIAWLEKQGGEATTEIAHRTAMKNIEQDVAKTGMADIAELLKPYYRQLTKQEELIKALAEISGKAGLKKAAIKQGQGFIVSLAKEAAKELTKQQLAEFFEQPAFKAYMETQVDMAVAMARWREASAKHRATLGLLELKRGIRDTLLAAREGYDSDTGWTEHKNDPWFADPGYIIGLELSEEGEKARDNLKVDLYLGELKLERDGARTGFVWKLPENAREAFDYTTPEKLDLTIRLQ